MADYLDPELLASEPPTMRPLIGGTLPSLGVPEYGYETPLYIPPQPPDTLTRLLGSIAGVRYQTSGGPEWPGIALGALGILSQMRVGQYARKEAERREANRRFESAAAFRNRQNIQLSAEQRNERERVRAQAQREREEKAKYERDTVLVPGTNERVSRESDLGRHIILGRPLAEFRQSGVDYVTIPTPQGPKRVPASSPAAVRAGVMPGPTPNPKPVLPGSLIPVLSQLEQDLGARSQRIVATARDVNLPPPAAADSLSGLARGIAKVHALLRQAQTTAEVDSIVRGVIEAATDTPAAIKSQLREGATFRRKQVADAR